MSTAIVLGDKHIDLNNSTQQHVTAILERNNASLDDVVVLAHDNTSILIKWKGGMRQGKWQSSLVYLYSGHNDLLGDVVWDCNKSKCGRLTATAIEGLVQNLLTKEGRVVNPYYH